MSLTEALAITQPHRAAELERARQQRAEDEAEARLRRKYPPVGTLAEAKAMLAQDMTEIFGEPISSEQQQTKPATAKASATTTTE